jgi:hypothetical protein
MEKDLATAKVLATMLEDEAAKLRKLRIDSKTNGAIDGVEGPEQGDAHMDEDNEDLEPNERGSEAVEKRVEKVMADLRHQGLLDTNNEKAVEEKRVC